MWSDALMGAADDSDVPEINICNVHDGSASFGQPEQRPQDGLWQNRFQRLLSDPYFSVSSASVLPVDCHAGVTLMYHRLCCGFAERKCWRRRESIEVWQPRHVRVSERQLQRYWQPALCSAMQCSMMQLDALEAAEGLPAACFRRSVPITGANLDTAARVPPALPPGPQQHGVRKGSKRQMNCTSENLACWTEILTTGTLAPVQQKVVRSEWLLQ